MVGGDDGGRFVGPGGDSAANVFDLYQGAVKDISLNEATKRLNFPLAETADMTKPNHFGIELFFGIGEILFKFDETIDMTPSSDFFLVERFLKGNPGSPEFAFSIGEAEIANEDALNITFKLTEADRIKILKGSNMPGGRGQSVAFAIVNKAFYDMAHIPFEADANIPIIEHPDDIPPVLTSAVLDLGISVLSVFSSEPLDLTYLVVDNFLLINDDFLNFTLLGSSIISTELAYVTNISIPESLRASVIRYTGTPGGDGVALQLNIYAGGLRDMGYNPSIEAINISMLEIGDTTPPKFWTQNLI